MRAAATRILITLAAIAWSSACSSSPAEPAAPQAEPAASEPVGSPPAGDGPSRGDAATRSPIGSFDFRNHSFPLPRGWQDSDGEDAVLKSGVRPLAEEEGRIGLRFAGARFFDLTGDGEDEAAVILEIDTGGAAVPKIVYIYGWREDAPALLWMFRTGDRADGGLKDLYSSEGELVVELFGRDRFVLGETETGRITGDEDDLCCPTFFTRSVYKLSDRNFRLSGKRLTYSLTSPSDPPAENMGEKEGDSRQ